MNLQCSPIQVPDFQTCKRLKEAGLLPPDVRVHYWAISSVTQEVYQKYDFVNPQSPRYIFAPTACQLLPLVAKLAIEKGYNLSFNFGVDYGADWIPYFRNTSILQNENTAQYLAEVLLWLLKQ